MLLSTSIADRAEHDHKEHVKRSYKVLEAAIAGEVIILSFEVGIRRSCGDVTRLRRKWHCEKGDSFEKENGMSG